jgi:hypothetical protein
MPSARIPTALVFAAGMTGGTLFAMAVGIAITYLGIDLLGVWRTLFASTQAQLRSALAWWAIAGAAFVGGFVIAFAMSHFEWLYLRFMRGVLLVAATLGLAAMARAAPTAEGVALTAYVAANLAATTLAAAMAAAGAFFGLRR